MKKITLTIFTILITSGLVLSACSSQSTPAKLAGTSWTLLSYGPEGNQVHAALGTETNLVFGMDGQVSGSLGCNSFSGDYKIQDGKLVFGLLASMLMACPELQMTQEGAAFLVLTGTVRFNIEEDTLTIYDANGANALTLSDVVNN